MNTITTQAEHVGANLATKSAYVSAAGTGIMGFIGTSEFAVISGFLVAIITFLMGWFYKNRDDKRKEERHRLDVKERQARIYNLEHQKPVPTLVEEKDPVDTAY